MTKFSRTNEPVAIRKNQQIKLHGQTRTDAYSWLKYIPGQGVRTMAKLPEQIFEHLQKESLYADKQLALISQIKSYFINDLIAKDITVKVLPFASDKDWYYYSEPCAGLSGSKFYRKNRQGEIQLLFDESQRIKLSSYYRATDHQASIDDRYFIWAEDLTGDDRHQICVLDIESSIIKTLVSADAYGYGGFIVSSSSKYLFWIWRDQYNRPARLYRTAIANHITELIYEEKDSAIFMKIKRSEKGSYIVLTLYGPTISEVYLIHKDNETGPMQLLWPRSKGLKYEVFEWGNGLLKLTNEAGAINNKLLYIDYKNNSAKELVAHKPDTHIITVYPFALALVRLIRSKGRLGIVLRYADGSEKSVDFPDQIYSIDILPAQSYFAETIRIRYQTPVKAPCWLDLNLRNGTYAKVGATTVKGLDKNSYKVVRTYALAQDGATIPITIVTKDGGADIKARPLLLTGYGAYGFASEAGFSLPVLALVDAGFNYAIAHVRGGSEKGMQWYRAACKSNKHKSMTDFIDCAHHLINTGVAVADKIVSYGVSAGGLLVCGAMNMAPDLWAGVIAKVPFVDMLNTMCDKNHPLVPLLRPDWGDPLSDKEAYDYIHGISPYENITSNYYPPLLCTAGLKDDRVPYWEPAKLIANMRYYNLSEHPAMLVLNPDSGHQESDNQQTEYAQAAMLWAFACECVGIDPSKNR